jgi:predicted GNAT family acetyltransferase
VSDIEVHDEDSNHRFVITVDGAVAGFARYRVAGDRIVFTHTEVDPAYEGQGLGSRLAFAALSAVRDRKLGIEPQCPFIAAYIKRHPEFEPSVVWS